MPESVVFFCKHVVLNVLAFYLVNVYISSKMCTSTFNFIQIGHLVLHLLNNHVCVHSSHSILYFPNDHHLVEELTKRNRYVLKNINYTNKLITFFQFCGFVSLICAGGICPVGYMSSNQVRPNSSRYG